MIDDTFRALPPSPSAQNFTRETVEGALTAAPSCLPLRSALHSTFRDMLTPRWLLAVSVMVLHAESRECYVDDMQEKRSGLMNWKTVPTCKALFLPRIKGGLRDRGVLAIVAELQKAGDKQAKLEEVDLAGNAIGANGATALASWINVSTKLRAIELRGNSLGDEGVSELASAIGNSLTLNDLGLAQTDMSDAGAEALATALQGKQEFTRDEWNLFGVDNLQSDHYIKSGDGHYKPAGTRCSVLLDATLDATPAALRILFLVYPTLVNVTFASYSCYFF